MNSREKGEDIFLKKEREEEEEFSVFVSPSKEIIFIPRVRRSSIDRDRERERERENSQFTPSVKGDRSSVSISQISPSHSYNVHKAKY